MVSSVGSAAPGTVEVSDGDGGFVLRNDLVTVTISSEGLITSALDHETGRDVTAPGLEGNLLQLHQDFPNMWDAWDVDRYYRNRVTDLRDVDAMAVSIGTDGSAVVVVERSFSNSRVRQELSLAPGSRVLLIDQTTDWHETEKFLKVAFPLDVRSEHTIAETQFGYHKRVTHTNTSREAAKFETSMHRFVLAEEPGFGAALVNDSTYGFDVTRDSTENGVTTNVRLSLLRAPRFPDPNTDQGRQKHAYGLVIGADIASATEAGVLLNTCERRMTGNRGFTPLVSVAGEGIILSSVKLAGDRSGDLIVRLYESQGRRAKGQLSLHAPVDRASTVTLLEEDIADAAPVAADSAGEVPLTLTAFEVRTLRFRLSLQPRE